MVMETKWYMVYIKAGAEKKVIEGLSKRKIESYSPHMRTLNPGPDQTHQHHLLTSYLFVRCSDLFILQLSKSK